MTKPRLAVGYHFYNDFDTEPEVRTRVRKTYDGPLALALDYMVFNVTKDDIRVRMSAIDEAVWPSPALKKKNPPDFTKAHTDIGLHQVRCDGTPRDCWPDLRRDQQKVRDQLQAGL